MSKGKKIVLNFEDLNNTDKISIIKKNDTLWETVKKNTDSLFDIVHGKHPITHDEADLLLYCVQLVLSELMINHSEYVKYPLNRITETKYLDSIEKLLKKIPPDPNNYHINVKKIKSLRKFVWGYIRKFDNMIATLLYKMTDPRFIEDDEQQVNDVESSLIVHCATVILIECALRQREKILFEKDLNE